MKTLYTKLKIACVAVSMLAMQVMVLMPGTIGQAEAAFNCPLNAFYGTVTVNNVPTNGIAVMLTDTTNQAIPLSAFTSNGGSYVIETANLGVCAAPGDQINISATVSGGGAGTVVPYALQPATQVNLAITTAVTPILTSITISPTNPGAVIPGAMINFTATPRDQNNVPMVVPVNWTSSKTAVGTIDASGMFMAVSGGTTTITAQSGPITKTVNVTVIDTIAPVITILGSNPMVVTQGTPFVDPGVTVVDNVDPNPSLSITGVVNTAVVGTYTITYTATDASSRVSTATRTVTVTAPTATPVLSSIAVTPATASLATGATQQLTATKLDQFGMPITATLTWSSSDALIASVDANGLVTGVATGTATITAMSGGVMSNASTITVTAPTATPVLTSITIMPAFYTIVVGGMDMLGVLSTDQFDAPIVTTLTWVSADPTIATVDATGMVMGVAVGTTTITASNGAISGSALVTVTSSASPDQVAADAVTAQISALPLSITLADATAVSSARIAYTALTVTQQALVTNLNVLVSAETTIATLQAPVFTLISLTQPSTIMTSGTTQQFVAYALDQFGVPLLVQPTLVWTSSDPTVGTVDATGLFTAIAIGTSTVTVSSIDGAITGTADVEVVNPVLSSIVIDPAIASVTTGATQQLLATTLDQFGMPFVATVTWSSSDALVASVDANGLVTGVATGTATIMAMSGGVMSNASTITVTAPQTISPVITPIAQQNATSGQMLSFTVLATNPNNGILTYSLGANAPVGASINATSGIFMWTPSVAGTSTFDVLVNDGLVPAVSIMVTIVASGPAFPVDNTPPMVAFTSPADLATGQALDRAIFVVFTNYNIDTAKINASNFIVKDNMGNIVPATIVTACCNKIAAFVPAVPLTASTTYTVTLTTGVTNLAGTPMAQPYTWSFTTAQADAVLLPTLEFTNPLSGGTNFPVDRMIHAIFNKKMDVTTVNANTYFLKDSNGSVVPVMYMSRGGSQFMLTPMPNLLPNATYTAYLTDGIMDLLGNRIATSSWSFTTGSLTNLHPTIASIATLSGTVNVPFTYQVVATDPNNDPISYSLLANAPVGMSIGVNSGIISWTPSIAGTYKFDVQASDGQSSGILRNVTVNIANAPVPVSSGGGGGGGGGSYYTSYRPEAERETSKTATSTSSTEREMESEISTGEVLGVSRFLFSNDIRQGMRGDDVRELQTRLREERLLESEPTGFFGPMTMDAVKKYQEKNNIPATGFVGALTRGKLNDVTQAGVIDRSAVQARIVLLQTQLLNLLRQLLETMRTS